MDEPTRLELATGAPWRRESLVGSWCHSFEDGDRRQVHWQGCVVAEPSPGIYLVETFDWLVGEAYNQRLVRIEDMLDWSFYDTVEWMKASYRPPKELADVD